MKKLWSILVLLTALGTAALAQGKIETKKYKIRDLQEKITKVVMTGNDLRDGALRQDIVERWKLSPFEFCTLQEFEALKKSADYYFLLTVTGQFGGESEPGIDFLTLVKGGSEAIDGISAMTEVVSVPFGIPGGTGREIAMLPALIDIIQDFALKAMEKDLEGYRGLSIYNRNTGKIRHRTVLFADSDLPFDAGKPTGSVRVVDEDDADDAMDSGRPGTVVSYTVAPAHPSAASRCYKLLIGADNHVLYYFKRHRISAKAGSGFTQKEFKSISKKAQ